MNFKCISDKLAASGFRREARDRHEEGYTIIDYRHRRSLDMYSVYIDQELGSVALVERTDIVFDENTGKYVPVAKEYRNLQDFNKSLA